MNIFTYGTLMFAKVWERVVSGIYEHSEAVASGYTRKRVKGELYPGLIPASANSQVTGIIYFDVSEGDLRLLDEFEGDYYERIKLVCSTPDRTRCAADAYLFKDAFCSLLEDFDWSQTQCDSYSIDRFLDQYPGFGKH